MKRFIASPARQLALLAIVGVACVAPGTAARRSAEAFLDAHYVKIDLDSARGLCAGLALEKIDNEIALASEAPMGADTRKPRVTYRLEESREDDTRGRYAYQLAIHASGTDAFHKLVVLTLRKESGGWRVTNFTESDQAAPG